MGFTTTAIHTRPVKADVHNALRYPQYDSVAFEFASSADIEASFMGRVPAHAYSRVTNPTVEFFEQSIAKLTKARGVLATASGMAAITTTIMTLAEQGSNIITTKYIFGNTLSLFTETLAPWGLETRLVDMLDLEAITAAIDTNTRAIFLESISNPQLQIADIKAICARAKEYNIPVVLDGTLSTPYIFDAKAAGVAVEVLSSTKYISGGATALGGLIIDYGTYAWKHNPKLAPLAKKLGPFALIKKIRSELLRNMGGFMSAHNATLQSIGLETLSLRIDKSCANALDVATFLEANAQVQKVVYPGLKSHPQYERAADLFGKNAGGIICFDLKDKKTCFAFMDALALIRRATNINDNKSLIIHPASTILCESSEAELQEMGVGQGSIRLSVGIEDLDDILNDIKQAFETI